MTDPWLHVLGIGEDGWASLSPAARALVRSADLLVGGDRHLEKLPGFEGERRSWRGGFHDTLNGLLDERGRRVVVVASGDPQWYGVGASLARHLPPEEMCVLPVPGAFSLAAARLCWSLADTETLTVHGRPMETVRRALAPGARLLILSSDRTSPAAIARMLTDDGWGDSPFWVLEHLGGEAERIVKATAATWTRTDVADLNTVAVDCVAGPEARVLPRVPGLPDDAFEHDGQITKREVRAVTLAALAPLPGLVLWDVGSGSGAVAIEWLRAEPRAYAVGIESRADRAARAACNALRLGTPELNVVQGEAPAVLEEIGGPPDRIFLGGGVSDFGLMEACWKHLKTGGILVANGVTLEAERSLLDFARARSGDLVRLEVARPKRLGGLTVWEPKAPVLQLRADKP